jgi:hypothetical protein
MKPSFHSLIPFLPLFRSCQFRRLDSVQFLCSHAHIPVGWRLETRVNWTLPCNHSERTTQKTQILYCWEGVFTPLLLAYSLPRGICVPSRCLAMNAYSDFAIPDFGRHVTVFYINHFRRVLIDGKACFWLKSKIHYILYSLSTYWKIHITG